MAQLSPKKINLADINGGKQYENGDGVQANAINAPIEASAYAQALATTQPNLENVNNFGIPSVSIEEVDGVPRFKFENLNAVEIENIEQTVSSDKDGGENIVTVTFNNGTKKTFSVYNGKTGAKLVSRVLQGEDQDGGNIYLDTFEDGTTAYFTAPRGRTTDKISDWMGTKQIGSPTKPLYYDGEKFVEFEAFIRPISLETASWDFIAQVAEAKIADQYFRIGEEKTVTLRNGITVKVAIMGFNDQPLANSTGSAGITFILVDLYENCSWNSNISNSNALPNEITMYIKEAERGGTFPLKRADLDNAYFKAGGSKIKYMINADGTKTPSAWWLSDYELESAVTKKYYNYYYVTSEGIVSFARGKESSITNPVLGAIDEQFGRCFGFCI